jgi:nucleotide-binding universal stress UspA family protein
MKRFKNILFLADRHDGPGPALARALRLAQVNQARLTMMDVLEPLGGVEGELRMNVDSILLGQRSEELDHLTDSLPGGDPVTIRVLSGTPFLEVIRAVLRDGYDLVMKTAETPPGLIERLLGSNDLHLLRKCPCPVWIDRPDAPARYRRIIAALDVMAEEAPRLNATIMELATSLAEREEAELHIVHAWRLVGESMMRGGRSQLSDERIEALRGATRDEHTERLSRYIEPFGYKLGDSTVHLIEARPALAIHGLAAEIGADVIVMGTVGRTGVPGLFMGNTAEDVLQNTRSAVVAVKPAGFVSPVGLPD